MTRKWGSCSTAGVVTLAADLARQDRAFQDYVIVHELLHLKVPNHGKVFKALMSLHLPGWRRPDSPGAERAMRFVPRESQ
jgi:predicted metal-dependent hydrolase